MSSLIIVGGIYRERCIWPEWEQVFGSGGRAAAALTSVVADVFLQGYAEPDLARHFASYAELYGFAFSASSAPQRIGFEYVHPMSVPVIRPTPARIHRLAPISVSGDVVLRFGMMEGSAVVDAQTCVYDPQSAFAPERFSANGSSARRLAVVANRGEILAMSGETDPLAGARSIMSSEPAEVVVVKAGAAGAMIVWDGEVATVPPYRSERVFTIGSGDVFAAAFAAAWAVHGRDPVEAARIASLAVAEYAASMALPIRDFDALLANGLPKLVANPGEVYLAGPFFSMPQRWLVDEARRCLGELGMKVFSPVHDVGPGPAETVGPADIAALERCDVVFALLDGLDSGTVFEVGYARAIGKPVFALAQAVKDEDLKMVVGTGCLVYDDFVTALHHLAWRP